MSALELPFSDPYLSLLFDPRRPASIMSAQAIGSTSHDVLSTTPPPVTRFLILSAPFARGARHAAEVLLWRRPGRSGESWAVILAWWVVCLGGGAMLK